MTRDKGTSVSMVAVGDVMLGDHPVCYGHGVRASIDRMGIDAFLAGVAPLLNEHDIATGNLEAVLSAGEDGRSDLVHEEMRGRPQFAAGLAKAGFNVMTVANNHALHHGEKDFADSAQLIRRNGIEPVGLLTETGDLNCFSFEKKGITVGVVGFSVRPEKYRPGTRLYAQGTGEQLLAQVRKLAPRFTALVVSIHWGEEYLHVPSPGQVELGRKLIDAGAAVVLGHHPHVLQGIERYGAGYIVYSLGNFVFDHWEESGKDSLAVHFDFSRGGVTGMKLVPIWIGDGHCPQVASGARSERILKLIETLSRRIEEYVAVPDPVAAATDYAAKAEKAYMRYRLESYRYFLAHLWRYSPAVIRQSFARALRRRAGSPV